MIGIIIAALTGMLLNAMLFGKDAWPTIKAIASECISWVKKRLPIKNHPLMYGVLPFCP